MFSWRKSSTASSPEQDSNANNSKFEVIDVTTNGNLTASMMSDSMVSSFSSFVSEDVVEEEAVEDETLSASVNSYCGEWERLFSKPSYLKTLKAGAMKGSLRSSRFRSVSWKLFLEVLPESVSEWSSKTVEWRNKYDDLKNQLVVNPRGAEVKDLSINNPLSQEVQSPWNQFFLDNELRLTIKQDVIRTFPDVAFYNDTVIQDQMVNILFCYARTHSDITYKQGMHELLAPLIFILHCDHQAFLHACDIESVGELTKQILDPQYLEHDAYALFYQIMETMESCYVSKELPPVVKGGTAIQSQPFVRPQDLHPSNVIVTKLTRIQDYLLKRFDNELYEHMQKMDIAPQIYGIRWVRLLFGREFPMQDLLMLWDAIFADGISFDLVDYIFLAMLLYLRKAMLTSDYPSCLHLLMKYPPVSDIQYFIDKALYLRDPHEYPAVSDYLYQKPANFGLNGWEYVPSYTHCLQTSQSVTSPMSESRRPMSLILGSNMMYKSNSEPMNLITDSAPSPAVSDYGEKTRRKGSTVSLSQIETSLMRGMVALRQNSAGTTMSNNHNTAAMSSSEHAGEASTSPRNGGKFFVFGARAGRKSSASAKPRQNPVKNFEQEAMRALGCIADMESMCRRCANELDVHIGTLQKEMLKREVSCEDDEVLLALAGIKQVRDVLKGVLKASSVFDSPESQLNQDGSSRRRQGGGPPSSSHSSVAATPLLEEDKTLPQGGKYYLATPDLLSSDTDLNSPDGLGEESNDNDESERILIPLAKSDRNPSNDTIVPKDQAVPDDYYARGDHVATNGKDEKAARNLKDEKISRFSGGGDSIGVARNVELGVIAVGEPQRATEEDGKVSRSISADNERATGHRNVSTQRQMSQDRKRDPSPINKLTDMFKSFAKF